MKEKFTVEPIEARRQSIQYTNKSMFKTSYGWSIDILSIVCILLYIGGSN